MQIIEAITTIRVAIEKSAATSSDSSWRSAVAAAGLESQGDKGDAGVEETFVRQFGPLELRVIYTWRDTSKTFAPGPDRTRVRLEVHHGNTLLDSYTNGYEE